MLLRQTVHMNINQAEHIFVRRTHKTPLTVEDQYAKPVSSLPQE